MGPDHPFGVSSAKPLKGQPIEFGERIAGSLSGAGALSGYYYRVVTVPVL
jgi:hypothetical protein